MMPRRGETMPDEQREKIAAALRGHTKDEEWRANIAEGVRRWHEQRRQDDDEADTPQGDSSGHTMTRDAEEPT